MYMEDDVLCTDCKSPISQFDVHCRSCGSKVALPSIHEQVAAGIVPVSEADIDVSSAILSYDVSERRSVDGWAVAGGIISGVFGAAVAVSSELGKEVLKDAHGYTDADRRLEKVIRNATRE
jgi:hypothetical protein